MSLRPTSQGGQVSLGSQERSHQSFQVPIGSLNSRYGQACVYGGCVPRYLLSLLSSNVRSNTSHGHGVQVSLAPQSFAARGLRVVLRSLRLAKSASRGSLIGVLPSVAAIIRHPFRQGPSSFRRLYERLRGSFHVRFRLMGLSTSRGLRLTLRHVDRYAFRLLALPSRTNSFFVDSLSFVGPVSA